MPDIQSNFLLESNGGDGTKVFKVLEVIPLILISITERVRRGSGLGSNEASRLKLCRCAALMGYRDQPTCLARERRKAPNYFSLRARSERTRRARAGKDTAHHRRARFCGVCWCLVGGDG
ncbi:hypothetical protein BM221_000983 [Beauveria bassiana]|uniref:Uncharacterized protein n=1 Tax=Beauveria bassiana TaxID=176275 RepID=A0A2N6P232_BEABA|nr:hypothetical protein BM221_000983 [Beauveria bassiana]